MAANKKNLGLQDDILVDIHDSSEVENIHRQFPDKTHEQILQR